MSRESESNLSRENVNHLKSRSQKIADPIHSIVPPSKSDSDDDCEFFMVGAKRCPKQLDQRRNIPSCHCRDRKIKEASERHEESSR
jgi:hypothetical protein